MRVFIYLATTAALQMKSVLAVAPPLMDLVRGPNTERVKAEASQSMTSMGLPPWPAFREEGPAVRHGRAQTSLHQRFGRCAWPLWCWTSTSTTTTTTTRSIPGGQQTAGGQQVDYGSRSERFLAASGLSVGSGAGLGRAALVCRGQA